jgi:predicted  nucleic acid-binding Zn-ribbon protein
MAAVMLISSFFVIKGIPTLFESRALIVVYGNKYDDQTNGAQMAAVTEQVTSRSNLEALILKYNLYNLKSDAELEGAVDGMRKAVKLDTKNRGDRPGFPESFTLSYRHRDPATAKQVVTDLLSIFDRANDAAARQAADESIAVNAEIAKIEDQLSSVGRQRASASARAGAAGRYQGEINRIRAERSTVNQSVETLTDRQYALQLQIAEQKRVIAQQQEIVRSAPPAETRSNGSYGALVRRKAELEGKLADYQAQYTETHPRVVQTREQLAEINRRIAESGPGDQTRAVMTTPESQELRSLQRELTRLETELEVVRREIDRKRNSLSQLPNVGSAPVTVAPSEGSASMYSGTQFEYEGLRTRYEALLKRQDSLHKSLSPTAGLGPALFQVVDQPNLPQMPAAPNRPILFLVALGLALVAGLVAVAIAEFPRLYLIQSESDVQYFLDVPVVALIPETVTPGARPPVNRSLVGRRATVFALGLALIPVLFFLLNFLGIFQMMAKK